MSREKNETYVEDIPLQRRLEIIEGMPGAKEDAAFSYKHELISKDSCDALIQHIETSLAHDFDSGVEISNKASSRTWSPFEGGVDNQYNVNLDAEGLIAMIGKDEANKVIDFWQKSHGNLHGNVW